jgi:signal transduction histidine kinase
MEDYSDNHYTKDKIKTIIQQISQIRFEKDIDNLCNQAIKHIEHYFNFDYICISLINYYDQRIKTEYIKIRDIEFLNRVDITKWKNLSDYKFDDNDILLKALVTSEIICVCGNLIDGEVDNGVLNKEIYDQFDHQNLNRAFIASVSRNEPGIFGEDSQYALGIFEVGYYKKVNYVISEEQKLLLKLYIDNWSQLLFYAQKIKEEEIIKHILQEADIESSHEKYLRIVLEEITKNICCDKSLIQLNFGGPGDKIIITRNNEEVNDAILRVINSPVSIKYNEIIYKDKKYIIDTILPEEILGINSWVLIPFIYMEAVVGVINVFNTRKKYFNSINLRFIQKVANDSIIVYYRKKYKNTLSNIVPSFSTSYLYEDPQVYKKITKHIQEYFVTEYAIFWQKDYSEVNKYLQIYWGSETLDKSFKKAGFYVLGNELSRNIEIIHFEKKDKRNKDFFNYAIKNEFNTLIFAPIVINSTLHAFLTIFLFQRIDTLLPEDESFLKLTLEKSADTIQSIKLTKSFKEISDSLLFDDLDKTLQTITECTKETLFAEPVILYRFDAEGILLDKTKVAGTFLNLGFDDIIKSEAKQPSDFIYQIYRSGKDIWFESDSDYKKHFQGKRKDWYSPHFKEDFWHREKIKSMIAVCLEINQKPVGVLCVNYRVQQIFNDLFREFVKSFARMASSAIESAELSSVAREFTNKQFQFNRPFVDQLFVNGIAHAAANIVNLQKMDHSDFNMDYSEKISKFPELKEHLESQGRYFEHLQMSFEDIKRFNNIKVQDEKKKVLIDNIEKIVIDLIKVKIKRKNILINTNHEKGIYVKGTEYKLIQVLLNLLFNSIRAVEQKQTLTAYKDLTGEINFSSEIVDVNNIKMVQISISDNGIGIDEADKKNIFKPFFSKNSEVGGSGIGLATSKYYIEQDLKGKLHFTSEKLKGTIFHIRLKAI